MVACVCYFDTQLVAYNNVTFQTDMSIYPLRTAQTKGYFFKYNNILSLVVLSRQKECTLVCQRIFIAIYWRFGKSHDNGPVSVFHFVSRSHFLYVHITAAEQETLAM